MCDTMNGQGIVEYMRMNPPNCETCGKPMIFEVEVGLYWCKDQCEEGENNND